MFETILLLYFSNLENFRIFLFKISVTSASFIKTIEIIQTIESDETVLASVIPIF